jgi:uncharacterized protein
MIRVRCFPSSPVRCSAPGCSISGMTDTTKVQGWLDVFGDWDPTLAFVLGGAILPMAVAWRVATASRHPRCWAASFPDRGEPRVGRNLVIGSLLFGMGWGLAGLCPGPAMASLSLGRHQAALVFLLSPWRRVCWRRPACGRSIDRLATS